MYESIHGVAHDFIHELFMSFYMSLYMILYLISFVLVLSGRVGDKMREGEGKIGRRGIHVGHLRGEKKKRRGEKRGGKNT